MPLTFFKPLIEITEPDLTRLIESQVRENLNLEYKEMMFGNTDEEKREMLRDISSMANAEGGHILIGIKEDDQNEGIPVRIVGIDNGDEASARITGSCLSNIDERIIGLEIHPVTLENGKSVVVIQIPRSPRAPHMVTFRGLNQFWKRHDRQKSAMSISEIREGFTATEQTMVKIDEFLRKRKDGISKTGMAQDAIYFVSASPYFVEKERIDIYDPSIRDLVRNPPGQRDNGKNVKCARDPVPNLHGLISESPGFKSLEIFRNGHCEFMAQMLPRPPFEGSFQERPPIIKDGVKYFVISSWAVVEYLVSFLRFYKGLVDHLNLNEPIVVSAAFFNALNWGLYELRDPTYQVEDIDCVRGAKIWRKHELEIPARQIYPFELPDKIAREFANRIWNAFNYERTPFFDVNDNFIPPRL